jgi:hypothetical protein
MRETSKDIKTLGLDFISGFYRKQPLDVAFHLLDNTLCTSSVVQQCWRILHYSLSGLEFLAEASEHGV